MSEKKLTLKEMAARLRCTEKTLIQDVRKKNIPHLRIGRKYLFDALKVEAFIENFSASQNVHTEKVKSSKKIKLELKPRLVANRFEEMLGLN